MPPPVAIKNVLPISQQFYIIGLCGNCQKCYKLFLPGACTVKTLIYHIYPFILIPTALISTCLIAELEKPDYDDKLVGGTGVSRGAG